MFIARLPATVITVLISYRVLLALHQQPQQGIFIPPLSLRAFLPAPSERLEDPSRPQVGVGARPGEEPASPEQVTNLWPVPHVLRPPELRSGRLGVIATSTRPTCALRSDGIVDGWIREGRGRRVVAAVLFSIGIVEDDDGGLGRGRRGGFERLE